MHQDQTLNQKGRGIMNKQRKQKISDIMVRLRSISDELEGILGDEQYSYDSIPENLQSSFRADKSSEAIDLLADAISSIDEAIDKLSEI